MLVGRKTRGWASRDSAPRHLPRWDGSMEELLPSRSAHRALARTDSSPRASLASSNFHASEQPPTLSHDRSKNYSDHLLHTCSSPEQVTRLVANAESWTPRGRATGSPGTAHQEAKSPAPRKPHSGRLCHRLPGSCTARGRATGSPGAQGAVPLAPRVPQQHRSGTSQIPVLRTVHRSSFTERQMLHPSQISPGYNAYLEIPR